MIALGGTIGTGLFVGSGKALATGGPLGILLGYSSAFLSSLVYSTSAILCFPLTVLYFALLLVMGLVVASMMVALGEMATLFPDSGGFIHFATRFVDPAAGFALGYNYWYCYAITLPTELTAASIVIGYWDATTNVAAWIAPLFAAVLIINFMGVRWYGEFEFWFSAIKVRQSKTDSHTYLLRSLLTNRVSFRAGLQITAIVGLIIFGVCISAGAAPNGEGAIGFRCKCPPASPIWKILLTCLAGFCRLAQPRSVPAVHQGRPRRRRCLGQVPRLLDGPHPGCVLLHRNRDCRRRRWRIGEPPTNRPQGHQVSLLQNRAVLRAVDVCDRCVLALLRSCPHASGP